LAPASNSPTPGALTVEEAGVALLAAEERLFDAWFIVQDRFYLTAPCAWTTTHCAKAEMKAGKEYWAMVGAALRTYVKALKAIRFPDVASTEAAAHIRATGIFRDRALSASKATTLDSFNARAAAAAEARDTTYGIQELKDALGLPVGP
jgi:hypothetical protein